jgi:heme-degrading monooxygenase HmoA
MLAVIMKFPQQPGPENDKLFKRFVDETPGVVHAYQLEGTDGGTTITFWESEKARDAYLNSPLRNVVDAALPGLNRTVYNVRNSK